MTPRYAAPLRFALASLIAAGTLAMGCEEPESISEEETSATTLAAHTHEGDETCFICDPSLREAGRLWCEEHGRYEDRCWLCHPELRDSERPYCEEHGLYEDECFLCDPSRADAAGAPAERPGAQGDPVGAPTDEASEDVLFCNEHRVPEDQCGVCQPQLAATLPVGESLLVRLASDRSADLAGLTIAGPVRADSSTSIGLLGEIQFNGNRLAEVSALMGGVIQRVDADLGQVVEAREVLAVVHSPGVATARADYISARGELQLRRAAAERQRQLFDENIASRRRLEEAEAAHGRARAAMRLARQRLLNLGFTAGQLTSVADARAELPLRAPFRGTVVRRTAVLGEAVETGASLFEIADLDNMWVDISVPEEDALHLGVDTPIQVAIQGREGVVIAGSITWVGPIVDERTRTVRARGVVPNAEGVLRHGMFVDVTAILDRHPGALRLPASAISRIENLPFVFVRREPDLFEARRVDVGDRLPNGEVVVLHGIEGGDEVVTGGAFVIKSAFLASRLGAGCVDD